MVFLLLAGCGREEASPNSSPLAADPVQTRDAEPPADGPWNRARREGIDFRAIGQEPGWHLEIRETERIRFVYEYGDREIVAPAPQPRLAAQRHTLSHATEPLDLEGVRISNSACPKPP